MMPAAALSTTPRSEVSSQGCTTMVRAAGTALAAAIRRSYLLGDRAPLEIGRRDAHGPAPISVQPSLRSLRLGIERGNVGGPLQHCRGVDAEQSATRRRRLATSPDIAALADSTSRIAAKAARRASALSGNIFGMAASAFSRSSSSMKNCSRTSVLNSDSVSRAPLSLRRTLRSASKLRSSTMPRADPT